MRTLGQGSDGRGQEQGVDREESGEGLSQSALSSFSALSFLTRGINLDLREVAQATAAHPEVANARRDYQQKLACWTSNQSEGNLTAVACAAITLSSLVSYYLGSR